MGEGTALEWREGFARLYPWPTRVPAAGAGDRTPGCFLPQGLTHADGGKDEGGEAEKERPRNPLEPWTCEGIISF